MKRFIVVLVSSITLFSITSSVLANDKKLDIPQIKSLENIKLVNLNKDKAIEVYNNIYKANKNLKNATTDTNIKTEVIMFDGENDLSLKNNLIFTSQFDYINNLMYTESKNKIEFLGEQDIIEQKSFYKDDKLYFNQGEIKEKIDTDLKSSLKLLSGEIDVNEFLQNNVILGATVNYLEDGKKEYNFNLNLDKSFELLSQFTQDLGLDKEDLEALNKLNLENTNLTLVVDENDKILNVYTNFSVNIQYDALDIKLNVELDMKYKDIDKTVVVIPNEDLSEYNDFGNLEQ